MRRIFVFVLCVIVACSLLAVPIVLQNANTASHQQQAVTKAIDYFKNSAEPYALLWMDVIHRRFGIAAFADALQRYDQYLASHPDEAPLLRVFRRIADYNNTLQDGDLQAISADIDHITVPALYSDRDELPADYPIMLQDAASQGQYMLTHVLLAWVWLQENSVTAQMPSGFAENLYRANAALINDDNTVTDVELEAAAFLYLAGQVGLVDSNFAAKVVAVQNSDGGWRLSSDVADTSNWHPSILALFFLLHVEHPAESYPPMLAQD
jgi:hypothetical protein